MIMQYTKKKKTMNFEEFCLMMEDKIKLSKISSKYFITWNLLFQIVYLIFFIKKFFNEFDNETTIKSFFFQNK